MPEDKKEENIEKALNGITKCATMIGNGDYENSSELYEYTNPDTYSKEVAGLAEAFGFMAVKLEAREISLERTIEELKEKKTQLENLMSCREEFTYVFINAIMLISIYTFFVIFVNRNMDVPEYLSRALEISIFVFSFIWVKKTKIPLKNFGVTFENSKKAIKESLIATVMMMIVAAVVKLVFMKKGFLFAPDDKFLRFDQLNFVFWIYVVIAIFQEFLARGVVQSSIKRVIAGKNSLLWAIVLSSILFGIFHIHMSLSLGILSIFVSLIWGWLYNRHMNLIGVSISHFIIGNWMVLLGFWELLRKS